MVPFAKDVNVGTSFYNRDLDRLVDLGSQSATNTWGTCSNSSYTTRSNCKSNGKTWTPDRTKWNGCVTDRDQDYDTMNTAPTSSQRADDGRG